MKAFPLFILLIFLFIACQNHSQNTSEQEDTIMSNDSYVDTTSSTMDTTEYGASDSVRR